MRPCRRPGPARTTRRTAARWPVGDGRGLPQPLVGACKLGVGAPAGDDARHARGAHRAEQGLRHVGVGARWTLHASEGGDAGVDQVPQLRRAFCRRGACRRPLPSGRERRGDRAALAQPPSNRLNEAASKGSAPTPKTAIVACRDDVGGAPDAPERDQGPLLRLLRRTARRNPSPQARPLPTAQDDFRHFQY